MVGKLLTFLTMLLAGCGLVTSQSIYEGLRTQQSVKDAGTQPKSPQMEPYGVYEKEREKAKSQQSAPMPP